MKKIAVVLCGSGYLDGSEIRESVGLLWALSEAGAAVKMFAPDEAQADVMNCLTGKPVANESRNQLIESARIARGQVGPLAELRHGNFDALIFPGGFGAAKNLCTFATQGSTGTVHKDVRRVLQGFHSASKPIGAICIAPAVLALSFPNAGFELTVGAKCEASGEIEKLGHKHIVKKPNEWHTDKKNKVSTTPAYMYDSAPIHEIFQGIRGVVRDVLSMA